VIWRRLSYFGDTLAHSALLGVTLAYAFSINISLSVFIISGTVALLLISLQKRTKLAGDSLLGLLAHSSLAIGLVLIGFLSSIRFDLMGLLFGDILAVTNQDILIIWFGGLIILGILFYIWKSIFAATVNYDLAAAEGMKPDLSNFIFTILLAGVIAISIKMIGALLITGLLLIPAATARSLSNNPFQMVILSILVGITSVITGLFGSLELNTASGPSIVVAALVLFILSISFNKSTALQK
jgi:ABC-type Mn2+/Zn2+ transport systems, permease components